jgi:hypothetical protein
VVERSGVVPLPCDGNRRVRQRDRHEHEETAIRIVEQVVDCKTDGEWVQQLEGVLDHHSAVGDGEGAPVLADVGRQDRHGEIVAQGE